MNLNLPSVRNGLLALIALPMALSAIMHFVPYDLFHFRIWGDRDILRAMQMFTTFPVTGAEYSDQAGLRTPGGGMYYLNFILFKLFPSVVVVHNLHIGLHVLAAFGVVLALWRVIGKFGAVVAGSLILTSPLIYAKILTEFWNPMQGWVFALVGFALFCNFRVSRRWWMVAVGSMSLALGAQCHVSFLAMFPAVLFFIRRELDRTTFITALGVFTACYAPYLASLVNNAGGVASQLEMLKQVVNTLSIGEPLGFVADIETVNLPVGALIIGFIVFFMSRRADPTPAGSLTLDALWASLLIIAFTSIAFSIKHQLSIGVSADRYFAPTVPFLAVLVGAATRYFIKHFWESGRTTATMTIMCLAILVVDLRAASNIHSNYMRWQTEGRFVDLDRWIVNDTSVYAFKEKLFEDLRSNFDMTNADILERLSVLAYVPKNKAVIMPPLDTAEYLLPRDIGETLTESRECVMVVSRVGSGKNEILDEFETTARMERVFKHDHGVSGAQQLLSGTRIEPFINDVVWRDTYALMFFEYPSGYCPRSLTNRYILTPAEQRIEAFFEKPKAEGVYAGSGEGAYFATATVPGSRTPLTMQFKLNLENGQVSPELRSNALRSYNGLDNPGYWQPILMERPRWRFVSESGASVTAYCFEGVLGQRAHPAPCKAQATTLEPGRYKVYFEADKMGYEERFKSGRPLSLAFPAELVVP